MQRDLDRLEHILAETVNIASFVEGLTFESFAADLGRRYSILHALAISVTSSAFGIA